MTPSRPFLHLVGTALACLLASLSARAQLPPAGLISRTNLVAWCIVPFDSQKRGPEARAAMLERLGLRRLAYDWRAEHVPSFDEEVTAMKRRGIEITAWWFPASLTPEAHAILACLQRRRIHPELWVTLGTENEPDPARLAEKIEATVRTLLPLCDAAATAGCKIGLYNHLGWFGEPPNQIEIIRRLQAQGRSNVGIVYNFHHAHAHIDRWPGLLHAMLPHLLAVNLNGMVRDGDRQGRKILPVGSGSEETRMIQAVLASGWRGPIGILGHTDDDAEVKLRRELDGLERLAPALLAQAPSRPPATQGAAPGPGPATPAPGVPAISGRDPGSQSEKDWADDRWQRSDVGPFLACSLVKAPSGSAFPAQRIPKALAIKLDPNPNPNATVAYDTATCELRWAWTGGFLRFTSTRFGLIDPPAPDGLCLIGNPGTSTDRARYRALHSTRDGIVIEFEAAGTRILERPWFQNLDGIAILGRNLDVGANAGSLERIVLAMPPGAAPVTLDGLKGYTLEGRIFLAFCRNSTGTEPASLESDLPLFSAADGSIRVSLPGSTGPTRYQLVVVAGALDQDNLRKVRETLQARGAGAANLTPHPARWRELQTVGRRGPDTDFLAVDTLTMPYDNPWGALMFGSGVDVMPDGTVFVSTIHGDVWRVTGVDAGLRDLRWRRFATGLYQALGLKIRDGALHVIGRDRITRLKDINDDGEADTYESFFDGIATSASSHEYVACLEKDDAGHFYYVDPKGVHRVAADGSSGETLATGFRNPNSLGVSPDGRIVTVAPQQGTWTPSSQIAEIRPGGYYGYGGPRPEATRPLGYDAPLLWIPHAVDNSSGSQAWIPQGHWGPLGGTMVHLLWGRCGMMAVLRDTGPDGTGWQGAVAPLPVRFQSGPNRATFDARTDALYVAGSTGWQTSSLKDGALERVRFTGRPVGIPVRWRASARGIHVSFPRRLDPATAADTGSYSLKRWNYRYSGDYGSKDWSVATTGREGRDEMEIRHARLDPDGQTVVLDVDDLKPVMQMELRYHVDLAPGESGSSLKGSLWMTVNRPHEE